MKRKLTFIKWTCGVVVLIFLATITNAQVVNDYRTTGDDNWGTLATWQRWNGTAWATPSVGEGYPGQFNTPGTVTILNTDDVTLNVNPTNSIGNLILEAGNATSSITFSGANSLTAGDITINSGTRNGDDKEILVNAGSLTCTSVTMLVTGNDNRVNRINITTGTVTVSGNITMNDNANRNQLNITGAGTLKVAGGITGGGLVLSNSSTVEYNGSSQTVRNVSYGNLIISGTGTKTLGGATTVRTNLYLNSGALAAGNNLTMGGSGTPAIRVSGGSMTGTLQTNNDYDVFYTGALKTTGTELAGTGLSDININLTTNETLTLDANRTPDGNVTITEGTFDLQAFTINRSSGGGTFTIQDGGWLKIGGTNSFPSNYSNHSIADVDATIEYYGTNQTISAMQGAEVYTILILSGSGVKNFPGARTVSGTLSMQGTATATGTSPTYGASAILEYKGSSAQTTSNVEFPTTVNVDLLINNAAGVSLNGQKTLSGALTLTNGILTTTSANLLIFPDNFSTVNGGSNTSYVDGPVRKEGNDAFTFPVGKSGLYSPLSITAPNQAGDIFQAEYMRASGALLGGISATGLYRVSNCEYWILDEIADPGNNNSIDVTVGWFLNSGCGGKGYVTDISGITLAHFDNVSVKWDSYAGTASGNPTTGTVTRTGVTVFSPFTLGSTIDDANPLPVKFSGIKAYEKQSGIQLDWTAYQEMDVDLYQVERSADGVSFVSIGTVDAKNLSVETRYTFFDASPLPGNNFYRLRNIDFDGKAGYSNIVKLSLDKSVKDITIYPNPVRGEYISLQSSDLAKGNYAVRLLNSSGQQVYMQRFSHTGGAINETIQLPSGMQSGIYFLQLDKEGTKVLAKPIVVQQ